MIIYTIQISPTSGFFFFFFNWQQMNFIDKNGLLERNKASKRQRTQLQYTRIIPKLLENKHHREKSGPKEKAYPPLHISSGVHKGISQLPNILELDLN